MSNILRGGAGGKTEGGLFVVIARRYATTMEEIPLNWREVGERSAAIIYTTGVGKKTKIEKEGRKEGNI